MHYEACLVNYDDDLQDELHNALFIMHCLFKLQSQYVLLSRTAHAAVY
jgi:hypothetical protein